MTIHFRETRLGVNILCRAYMWRKGRGGYRRGEVMFIVRSGRLLKRG